MRVVEFRWSTVILVASGEVPRDWRVAAGRYSGDALAIGKGVDGFRPGVIGKDGKPLGVSLLHGQLQRVVARVDVLSRLGDGAIGLKRTAGIGGKLTAGGIDGRVQLERLEKMARLRT